MGCCADDHERFPDCRPDYLAALAATLRLALRVRLEAPLVMRTKAETLSLARELGAWDAVALSWSCYAPQDAGARRPIACRSCLACKVRAMAFEDIGEDDPAR